VSPRTPLVAAAITCALLRCQAYDHSAYQSYVDAIAGADFATPDGADAMEDTDAIGVDATDVVGVDAPSDLAVDARIDVADDTPIADVAFDRALDTMAADSGFDGTADVPRDVATDARADTAADAVPTILFGTTALGPSDDTDLNGVAEAFETQATMTAPLASIVVYFDTATTASMVIVGVYSDAGGHPGSLLARGSFARPDQGAWATIAVTTPVSIASGTPYWIALLVPMNATGAMQFLDQAHSGSPNETSLAASLMDLPATWTTGRAFGDGPISAYGLSGP
jgi:hypothetical protein